MRENKGIDAMDLIARIGEAAAAPVKSPAQLRLLISQDVDLGAHLPQALGILCSNPLVEAEYYPGDLLKAVLSVDHTYWARDPEGWERVHAILGDLDHALGNIHEARARFVAMK